MQEKSFTRMIKALKEKVESEKININDHCLISIEADENGLPTGKIASVKGAPFVVLGMIEILKETLEETRYQILEKFEKAELFSENLRKKTSSEVIDKLRKIEERAREAMKKNDFEELERLKDEAEKVIKDHENKSDKNDKDDDKDSSDFDINDFKGSF